MSKQALLEKYADQRTRTQVYTRVMGYVRDVDHFNTGKKGEFKERTFFTENKCKTCAQ